MASSPIGEHPLGPHHGRQTRLANILPRVVGQAASEQQISGRAPTPRLSVIVTPGQRQLGNLMDLDGTDSGNRNGAGGNSSPAHFEALPGVGAETAVANSKRRRRRLMAAALLGGILLGSLACLLGFVALMMLRRESLPPLTRAAYESALQRWEAQGPANYELDLTLEGRRAGHIHVEVHRGEVTSMTRDGIEPAQRRTWDYWSVPGQFDTLDRELELAADPQAGFHASAGAVVQQAEFDPTYGYPRRYRRFVLGSDQELDWQTTHFKPLP